MGQIIIDQSHQVMATLATNADWASIDFEGSGLQNLIICNPKEAGRQFTAFLKNGGRVVTLGSQIINIDRAKPFDPVAFIDKDWTINEQDEKSLALTEVGITKVRFETMLKSNESSVVGEEKLKRLKKAGYIRLDAKVFQTLWENQDLIPESWKEKINGNTRYIFFDGTILRYPDGRRCVLFLCWCGDRWNWSCSWLDGGCSSNYPSAVLAS